MKLPLPREPAVGSNGFCGVGTKSGPRPWTPGSTPARPQPERVPERLRRVRLRRATRSRMDTTSEMIPAPVVFAILLVLGFVVWVALGGRAR